MARSGPADGIDINAFVQSEVEAICKQGDYGSTTTVSQRQKLMKN